MDTRQILTSFKDGRLDRRAAADLLTNDAPRQPDAALEPIALIGYSARYPGADDADAFWDRIADGDDLVTEVPAERWSVEDHYDPNPSAEGRSVSRWGGFVDGAETFDADFFAMTPREAELTDPQARVFLQEAWRALEHAAQPPSALTGARCGVYAGVMLNDYGDLIERESEHALLPQVMQGNSNSLLSARIAYHLDLRGPAATIDTACSSSLVAVHMACQSLWLGEADLMLAGGVSLYLTELPHVYMSRAGMLSPTGRCRPFDASADGIVPGEGCGVVVLKKLTSALADGDPVHAVIRASGTNQDGRTNGITAPSGSSQSALIRGTYDRFGVDPSTVDYVECHGTGTPLGDPIEVGALNTVFADRRRGTLPIGSVKANAGHTSAAAGIAGLLKAVGVVRTGLVPPTPHYDNANPQAPFAEGPLRVADRGLELGTKGRPRRAAVSAFGFSGTNAHVVVDEAPATDTAPMPATTDRPVPVVLSARRRDRLPEAAARLAAFLRGPGTDARTEDVGYTLAVARAHNPHRTALVVRGRGELLTSLDLLAQGRPDSRRLAGDAPPSASPDAPTDSARHAASQYVRGEAVDWEQLFPTDLHHRVSLPGYPFAPDTYSVRAPRASASEEEVLLFREGWEDAPMELAPARPDGPVVVHDRDGVLSGALADAGFPVVPAAELARADTCGRVTVVLRLVGATDDQDVLGAVDTVRAVLTRFRSERITVLAISAEPVLASAASALVKSVRLENPRVDGRAVLVSDDGASAVGDVSAELADTSPGLGHLVDRRHGSRLRAVLEPTTVTAGPAPRLGGVHLVTGGMGGIGRALAAWLVREHGARVVLCGRTPWEELDPALRPDPAGTGGIRYVCADVSDRAEAAGLVRDLHEREGALNGVFHAAGVVRDAYLVRKGDDDPAAVLAPKSAGARALDEATAHVDLDAFVLFSSVAAVTGNEGQSDYALANAYLDGFARERAQRVRTTGRGGRTLSVQWPLWDSPGMAVPEPVLEVVRERTGMRPLPVETGLAALDTLLAADGPEVVSLFHGDGDVWRSHLAAHDLVPVPAAPSGGTPESTEPTADRDAVAEGVRRAVTAVVGRPEPEIGTGTNLESLGLDSVMMRSLAARLTSEVAPIRPEELFGCRDLGEVVDLLASAPPTASPPPPPHHTHAAPPSGTTGVRAASAASAGTRPAPDAVGASPASRVPPLPPSAHGGPSSGAVAVVGLSGRYPGAPDLEVFWENLVAGRDLASDAPVERWNGSSEGVRGYFLDAVDRFDPLRFGLSDREAELMDPQERLLLEVARNALEDGGYAGRRLDFLKGVSGEPRDVGVYVGVTSGDYRLLGASAWANGNREVPASHYWSPPNRLSYLFDLRGPSQAIDTACSSSLVALHQAVSDLRRGECAAALVGGVNLYLHPSRFHALRQSGFLSDDGRCRSFGEGGTGFGPGEGAGAVLVRPLEDALADGDHVHGVILGGAVAHAGRGSGFTAPSPSAQARTIRGALEDAGVDPDGVGVIEAHGTGTALGDPVELAGLRASYGSGSPGTRGAPRSLGSVKSAIGHGESVAGIAALTKVLMQLRHRTLAPSLHARRPNPELSLEESGYEVQHEASSWTPHRFTDGRPQPRRAGISSFGAGGVNAHVLVQEPPSRSAVPRVREAGPELVLLSAPTRRHLRGTASVLAEWISTAERDGTAPDLADLAYTLRVGREEEKVRLAAVVSDPHELVRVLQDFARSGDGPGGSPGARVSESDGHWSGNEGLGLVPETREYLEQLWRNRRLDQLGSLWLAGVEIDWCGLARSTEGAARVVSLPPSAHIRRSFWFGQTDAARTPHAEPVHASERSAAPEPEPGPRPEPEPGPRPEPEPGPRPESGVRMPAPPPTEREAEASVPGTGPSGPDGSGVDGITDLVAAFIPGAEGPIDPHSSLLQLGIDSINLVSLNFELIEQYGKDMSLRELSAINAVQLADRLAAPSA
ncbi:hypothetical protein GCM10007079_08650 [Nocardiopsis terrae]|uniref:Acyl transferase domain-containing protein/acyl carrier protein n=1 Tax=Nocardiopsis terrae TaxID=372655 RepID=A0ABR9HD27_9ACTN|nr:SDR family NAD(P)-dependent oxidoreductase [Nocardiopsis terrae]MBE1456917.1 acyl transferase domain-containing protein/acyl carrier protein [Nocardiopsis terrae]GHC74404.1 hypothetical protein GCM10007079_08650 [Nocardiopsis terrae]